MNILPTNYGLASNPSPLKYGPPPSLSFPINQQKSYEDNFDSFLDKMLNYNDRIIRARTLEELIKLNNTLQQKK
jgi:hypothetical protein